MTKVKILIVSSYPYLEDSATANRISTFADVFANDYLFDVTVVAFESKYKKLNIQNSSYKILLIKQKEYNKRNFYIRGFNEIFESYKLLKIAKKEDADINIISLPSIFLLSSHILLRKKSIIYDVRDLVWKYIINKRVLKFLLEKVALYILKKSKMVLVTNQNELMYLKNNFVRKTIKISNGISDKQYKKLCKINLKKYNYKKNYELLYIGNIGYAQKLQEIIDVVGNMEEYNLKIIGKGNELTRLSGYIKCKNFNNITFHGYVPWNDIIKFIIESDCLIGQIGQEFQSAIPSKLYEYAASGRNILFGLPDGAAKDVVNNFKGFNIFKSGDKKSLKELLYDAKSFSISQEEVEHNRLYINENFIREKEALKLVSIIKENSKIFGI